MTGLGRRPTRAEVAASVGGTTPDLVDDRTRLLLVGINPSLWSVAAGSHFARPGNRFWPAWHAAGVLDRVVDASAGMTADDTEHVLDRGLGITNVAWRGTARADQLTDDELRAGRTELAERLAVLPGVRLVAVLGLTAFRVAFDRPRADAGATDVVLAGRPVHVAPNPSGLNAHETVASLAHAYRALAVAAGLVDGA